MSEYVICGASFETVCSGELPPEDMREMVNAAFEPDWQAPGGYRILPRVLNPGREDEEDLHDDGTWRTMPKPITHGDVVIFGGVICTSCYVTVCMLSPSGSGLTHEIMKAIEKARTMDPAELPAIR